MIPYNKKAIGLWDDWMLIHHSEHDYELLRLSGNRWVSFLKFTANNDAAALEKVTELIGEVDRTDNSDDQAGANKATKDTENKTVDCVACRKPIPIDGAHCMGFGIYQCPACQVAHPYIAG